jgi:hypothetical protein
MLITVCVDTDDDDDDDDDEQFNTLWYERSTQPSVNLTRASVGL